MASGMRLLAEISFTDQHRIADRVNRLAFQKFDNLLPPQVLPDLVPGNIETVLGGNGEDNCVPTDARPVRGRCLINETFSFRAWLAGFRRRLWS